MPRIELRDGQGKLVRISGAKNVVFLTFSDDEGKRSEFFCGSKDEFDTCFLKMDVYYSFQYQLPKDKKFKPILSRESIRCVVEEEGLLMDNRDSCFHLAKLWDEEIKYSNVHSRIRIFKNLKEGIQDEKISDSRFDWDCCLRYSVPGVTSSKSFHSTRADYTLRNVGRWLRWDYQTGTSSSIHDTELKWSQLLENPYALGYFEANGKDAREIRKIKARELARMDEVFLKHALMEKNDERRIEYFCYDSIHHGKNPLVNLKTCYTLGELWNQMKLRKMGMNKKYRPEDDDDDFEDKETVQSIRKDPPTDDKLQDFLKNIEQGKPLHAACRGKIVRDRGYFYDASILRCEKSLAVQIADAICSDCKDVSAESWYQFKRDFPVINGMLSQQQEEQLLLMVSRPFYMVIGVAGSGKTTLEIIVALFLEWVGYKVFIGTMVGMAAVRAADVWRTKVQLINAELPKPKRLNSSIRPRTLNKLMADLNDMVDCEWNSKGKVLIIDEMSTVSFDKPCTVISMLQPERVYGFGDHRQLHPIRGQHLLDELISLSAQRKDIKILGELSENFRTDDSFFRLARDIWNCKNHRDRESWIDRLKQTANVRWVQEANVRALLLSVDQAIMDRGLPPFIMAPSKHVIRVVNRRVREMWLGYSNSESLQRLVRSNKPQSEENVSEVMRLQSTVLDGDVVMCIKNLYKTNEGDDREKAVVDDEEGETSQDAGGINPYIAGKELVFANGEFGLSSGYLDGSSGILVKKLLTDGSQLSGHVYEAKRFRPTYAVTVHKAQGSEYDETIVTFGSFADEEGNFGSVNKHVNSRSGYTAMTRHRKRCTLFATEDQLLSMLSEPDPPGYRSHLLVRIKEALDLNAVYEDIEKQTADENLQTNVRETIKQEVKMTTSASNLPVHSSSECLGSEAAEETINIEPAVEMQHQITPNPESQLLIAQPSVTMRETSRKRGAETDSDEDQDFLHPEYKAVKTEDPSEPLDLKPESDSDSSDECIFEAVRDEK